MKLTRRKTKMTKMKIILELLIRHYRKRRISEVEHIAIETIQEWNINNFF
jgi:hypothetical protein